MKYSLRSLMIAMTLICVVPGGRIEYLRRIANFHARESEACDLARERLRHRPFEEKVIPLTVLRAQQDGHIELADEYSTAMSRRWSLIRSPQPLANFDEWFQQLGKNAKAQTSAP